MEKNMQLKMLSERKSVMQSLPILEGSLYKLGNLTSQF
jgi:hypothetical protein